ncbi:unnamed protein product [Zymoseptoria tritici ST99CH_3D1]|uniref:Ubiquitin 3 binding protein But2 C-terminal domain-containing protein n=2 Tax=Zymoseptoria tritici TaxID=1047171 RepID=A0A1X7S5L9_ZYMT9|nr:unnamed protein product [Zymoseptoria tritici ST99CH_3D7]SMR59427.1 unnamed protein product [Zymoseptoria tritici ST99CH_1E4]SMR63260.1 unnamed protein product [Zymoseptoria tritici ST99CH_3D1]
MLPKLSIASLGLLISTVSAACSAEERVRTSLLVATAYNTKPPLAAVEAFKLVPWGAPDAAGVCTGTIIPDGSGCAIVFATTGEGTYDFAVETRQVFESLVVKEAKPFTNGTVLLSVEVHVGAPYYLPSPVSFHGYVYMDYNDDCRIYAARGYADVPSSVLNWLTPQAVGVPGGGLGSVCMPLPVGGQ